MADEFELEDLHGPLRGFDAADLYRSLRKPGKTIRSTINCVITVLAAGRAVPAFNKDMRTLLGSGLLTMRGWLIGGLSSWLSRT